MTHASRHFASRLLSFVVCIAAVLSPLRAGAQSPEVQEVLDEGDAAFARGDYDRAARLYDRAIAAEPKTIDPAYYAKRAEIFAFQKKWRDGLEWIASTAEPHKGTHPLLLEKKALLLMGAGRGEEAVAIAEAVLAQNPSAYALHLLVAEHRFQQGEKGAARAAKAYRDFLATRPPSLANTDRGVRLKLGYALLRLREYVVAQAELGKLLAAPARNAAERSTVATARRGLCAADVGARAFARAARSCAAALEQGEDASTLLNLGRALHETGRHAEALAAAERYLELRPGAPRALILRADVLAAQGQLARAEADLLEVDRALPGRPQTDRRLGHLYLAMQPPRAAQATERLERASRALPDDPEIAYDLAKAYSLQGRHEDVVQLMAPWIEKRPDDARARLHLGRALLALERSDDAIPHLEKAAVARETRAAVRPLLVDALNAAAVARLRAGRAAEAEPLLLRADAVADDPMTWKNLGLARLLEGRAADALAPLDQAVAAGRDPVASLLRGRALRLTGRFDEARAELSKGLSRSRGDAAIALRLELAGMLLDQGQPAEAVDVLQTALGQNASVETRRRIAAPFVVASRAWATELMQAGSFERAHRALTAAEPFAGDLDRQEAWALSCDAALAATGAGAREAALARLRRLKKEEAVCPFPPPADRMAVAILLVWNEGLAPGAARKAVTRLEQLAPRGGTGPLAGLVAAAMRQLGVMAAVDEFVHGRFARARALLLRARELDGARSPELAVDLAAVDLEEGKRDAALPVLEKHAAEVPEALVHLAIAHERAGQPLEALELYRRAAAQGGLRFPALKGWIREKERLWGGGGSKTP